VSTHHRTQVCTSRDFDTEWARLIDELARRGVLRATGAAEALLGVAAELAAERDQLGRAAP
jgi:hypothetical protein